MQSMQVDNLIGIVNMSKSNFLITLHIIILYTVHDTFEKHHILYNENLQSARVGNILFLALLALAFL